MSKTSLVFVYNADSGLFNTVTDIAHKILSPDTYSCNLCAITHSYFSVKQQWTDFLEQLDVECEFLHRDELSQNYGVENISLPVILEKQENGLRNWLNTEDINACDDIETLKTLITNKLKQV